MKRILPIFLIVILLTGCIHQDNQSGFDSSTSTIPEQSTATSATTTQMTTSQTTTPPVDPLETLLNSLTLEQRVGQLFLARCPDRNAVEDIGKYHLGGYILYARDFENETPDSVKETIAAYQNASSIPMLIAVDEEGGRVNRVSQNPAFRDKPFDSNRNLYAQGGLAKIRENEREKCLLLRSLGINVNLAPVCDVSTDPKAFMYPRSLGQSPEITGEFVTAVMDEMRSHQIGGVLKHFPGYGNNTDTHIAIAVDERPLSQLEAVDLVPFSAGISSGCDGIMVSHVYMNAIDAQSPATLSPAVHQYLRDTMGFEGVIVTDDLAMKAITDVYGVGESAVLAVLAGNDLLCVTEYAQQYDAVLSAAKQGRIPLDMLNSAVMRILRWKQNLGLI